MSGLFLLDVYGCIAPYLGTITTVFFPEHWAFVLLNPYFIKDRKNHFSTTGIRTRCSSNVKLPLEHALDRSAIQLSHNNQQNLVQEIFN